MPLPCPDATATSERQMSKRSDSDTDSARLIASGVIDADFITCAVVEKPAHLHGRRCPTRKEEIRMNREDKTKLKRCPLCGAAAILHRSLRGGGFVHCEDTDCYCATGWNEDAAKAVEKWNRRFKDGE